MVKNTPVPSSITAPTVIDPLTEKPEVLAPAGDWECAKAAVENGADAIYFGIGRFNARVRAHNFTIEDLGELMRFLHRRGVRGYVAFNTLIFTDELAEAARTLKAVIAAGVDAAIVQDVGICRLIRRLSLDFPIHASTQMTVTSEAGLDFARSLGANLAVLARECSITEMDKMRTECGGQFSLPVEVFVHGALCVAYSGQCLTSESLGGRSANRGECAQACRQPYVLLKDGVEVPLGGRKYLLSPQDLAGIEAVPNLVRSGVRSLKIEGRLKNPEYVAAITRAYRQAVDNALASTTDAASVAQTHRYAMEMSFSRGLYSGWLHGIDNRQLVHARFGTKRGAFLGLVSKVDASAATIAIQLESPLKPGDGIVFDAGQPEKGEEGGRVHAVEQRGAESIVRFRREDLNWKRVATGQRLWKTSDPELQKELRQTFAGEQPRHRNKINLQVSGALGLPLVIEADDGHGHHTRVTSAQPLVNAEKQPLTADVLQQQLGRLGGTPFELGTLECRVEGNLLLPLSELNRMRRDIVERLIILREEGTRWQLNEPASAALLSIDSPVENHPCPSPELIPLVRTLDQLTAALEWGATTLYAELEDPKKYRDAVALCEEHNASHATAAELWVAPPRIYKQGENWILRIVESSNATGYLVRNHEHLRAFQGKRLRGDFSLNTANPLTAEYYLTHYKLERLTASYDLNSRQLEALLQAAPAHWFEVTLHQHMPMFHMEHCVFCAFLTTGKDYRDCGRPCEKHEVKLRDHVGIEHTLKADAGCRNTLYNGKAQTGAEFARRFAELGVPAFRIEFLDESPATLKKTLDRYRALLNGQINGADLWRELKLFNQLGVTRGTLR